MAAEQSKQSLDQAIQSSDDNTQETDQAVDESSDVDGDFAQLQKVLSQKRRAAKENPELRLQKALPFPFLPNIRPLTISDYESCVQLENAAFPDPEHRASPEKFQYRLTTCPELSLGVFCTVVPEQVAKKGWERDILTLASARPVETDRADGAVSVLLAHIVSTRCKGDVVSDADMDYPKDWRTRSGKSADVGHQETGKTIALHSLAVLPKLQGCGIGKMIMKAYLQQVQSAGLGERVALICQDYLVSYYERFGYKSLGPSKAQFGGGGWTDMVFEL
ncbi:acyl-CoA N-acyltransferase [Podospora australis]|uniref:Acyl-CoA N-acyltransferase n=1 Tax=Podospora australis TaxID=1536484 RepID=A0AAN6X4J9_9PEZI|nr:acyl-CoA N-acyltransferase [Podospora australis]